MKPKIAALLLLIFFALITLSSSVFTVNESQQAFITQFGRPVGDTITTPGIRFKLPFIQRTHFFDKRFLEWDGAPNQVTTKDKKYIFIDTYARWRIQDALLFFQQVEDEIGAQSRLDDVLDGATRRAVANHDLVEIVRSQHRPELEDRVFSMDNQDDSSDFSILPKFEVGRNQIAANVLAAAKEQLQAWGIELLDLQFKRINYTEDVQKSIFERMTTERKRIADRFRSEGQGEAANIRGQMDKDLKTIESEAYRKAQEIQGKADADAITIYATAYDQSPESREFYQFLKTMESYQQTLSEKDWLILSTESDFFQFLRGPSLSRELPSLPFGSPDEKQP